MAALPTSLALAVAILSGCGSPATTYEGSEVEDLDKTIESLDAMWIQNRADGIKSNVDESSRCYAQVADLAMSENAICGPIHYLGDDDQVWEAMTLSFTQTGDKQTAVSLDPDESFHQEASGAGNATLYRPDGKEPPVDLVIPEPDAETAPPEQAIWADPEDYTDTTAEDGTSAVNLPNGVSLQLSNWKISERIGSSSDRLMAGDNRRFASISISGVNGDSASDGQYGMEQEDQEMVPTTLAFASGGESYSIGAAKDGTVSMSLPEDEAEVALEITTDGLTQTVSLGTGAVTSSASAYYDGLELQGSDPESGTVVGELESEEGMNASVGASQLTTTRDAYEPELGWAPEGKAWLIVNTGWKHELVWQQGIFSSLYTPKTEVTSATVESISGESFSAEAIRIDEFRESSTWNNDSAQLIFEVPAGVGDFRVSMDLRLSGDINGSSFADEHPASLETNFNVAYETVFVRDNG